MINLLKQYFVGCDFISPCSMRTFLLFWVFLIFCFHATAPAQGSSHGLIAQYEAMVKNGYPRLNRTMLEPFTDEENELLKATGDHANFEPFSEEHRLAFIEFFRAAKRRDGVAKESRDVSEKTNGQPEKEHQTNVTMKVWESRMGDTEQKVVVDPVLARAVELAFDKSHLDYARREEAERLFLDYIERNPESPFRPEIYYRIAEMYVRVLPPSTEIDHEKIREWRRKSVASANPELYSLPAMASHAALVYGSWRRTTFEEVLEFYDYLVRFENITVDIIDPTAELIEHTEGKAPIDRRSYSMGRWLLSRRVEKREPNHINDAIKTCEDSILKRSQDPVDWKILAERYPNRRLGIEAGKRLDAWREGEFNPSEVAEFVLSTLGEGETLPEPPSEPETESDHSAEESSTGELADETDEIRESHTTKDCNSRNRKIYILFAAFIVATFFGIRKLEKKSGIQLT